MGTEEMQPDANELYHTPQSENQEKAQCQGEKSMRIMDGWKRYQ